MKKLWLVFIVLVNGILFFSSNSVGQTYSSVVSDQEITGFLNWLTIYDIRLGEEHKGEKSVSIEIVDWQISHFIPKDSAIKMLGNYYYSDLYLYKEYAGTDTIFLQEDREFLYNQFKAIKDSVWHDTFENSEVLNKNEYKPEIYYRYYKYSIPLFSKDKQYVIVQRDYLCGRLCGYGGCFVYRKVGDHKWEYVTGVNVWLS